MDPEAALAQARSACAQIGHQVDVVGKMPDDEDVDRLVTAFEALDEWLCKGGFLPDAWIRPYQREEKQS